MYVVCIERVELDAYQIKSVSMTWYEQWKEDRYENAPHPYWACLEEALLGSFFHRELKKAKVREFLTLKQDSQSVNEY